MWCIELKMNLLEDYDDSNFIHEIGSIILKGYLLEIPHQTESNIYFQDYQPDVISFQYSHLMCAMHKKLIKVQIIRCWHYDTGLGL